MSETRLSAVWMPKTKVLAMAVCLAGLGGLWAWTENDKSVLELEMAPHVEECIAEFNAPGMDTRAALQVSRDLVVAGPARAKVEVFNKDTAANEVVPEMFQVFFVREDGAWVREGSGRCTDKACAIEANSLFANRDAADGDSE